MRSIAVSAALLWVFWGAAGAADPPARTDLPPGWTAAIETTPLDAPAPDGVGLLAGTEGLGEQIWQGAEGLAVEKLLARLPARPGGQTLQALARRLLLTQGPPPAGATGMARLRLEALMRMGLLEDAAQLADALPGPITDESLARAAATALWAGGRRAEACGRIGAAFGRFADPFWGEAAALCDIAAGEDDRALLALQLLRESGGGDPARLARIEALAVAADAPPPPGDELLLLAAWLDRGGQPPADFAPEDPAAAALLAAHRPAATGKLDWDRLQGLAPTPDLADMAAEAAMLCYVHDAPELARSWLAMARVAGNTDVAAAAARLLPLKLVAEGATARPAQLEPWLDVMSAEPARIGRVLAMMEALGDHLPAEIWRRALDAPATEGKLPPVALTETLEREVGEGRIGLAILTLLVMLGEDAPASAHPIFLTRAVRALNALGFRTEARRLAAETIALAIK